MESNETMGMGFGGYGFLVVIILVLIILFGGGGGCLGGLFGGGRNNCCGNGIGGVEAIEKQNIITAAETNYRVIDENRRSTDLISAQLRNQWDAEQGEKLFDLKINALAMQQGYEAKLIAKDATIERMTLAHEMGTKFDALAAQIADIRCNMLGKPQVFGIGTSCNSIITPPLQTYGGYGGCCGGNVGGVVVG